MNNVIQVIWRDTIALDDEKISFRFLFTHMQEHMKYGKWKLLL